jgi:YebC/PmpR family DNA-binding regulatory protein
MIYQEVGVMAGHSKWANIKHRKGAQDAKRGKLFTKLIRETTVAARLGGDDLGSNPRLRAAVDAALGANMPKDTITRAIKRGAGGLDGDNVEEIRYEGYGVGGVAVMVDCLSDNRNRTVAEVRHAFSKCGGNLGTDGSVAYLFQQRGVLRLPLSYDEDAVMEVVLKLGADDFSTDSDCYEVICAPEAFESIKDGLVAEDMTPEFSELTMEAELQVTMDLSGAEKMMRLLDMLEDLDDVQKVYSNADIPDEVLAQMAQ